MLLYVLHNQIYRKAPLDAVLKGEQNLRLLSVLRAAFDAVDAHEDQQVLYQVHHAGARGSLRRVLEV